MIGRGSFGSVYEGNWKGKDVALKRIEIPVGMHREQVAANSHELKVLRYVASYTVGQFTYVRKPALCSLLNISSFNIHAIVTHPCFIVAA